MNKFYVNSLSTSNAGGQLRTLVNFSVMDDTLPGILQLSSEYIVEPLVGCSWEERRNAIIDAIMNGAANSTYALTPADVIFEYPAGSKLYVGATEKFDAFVTVMSAAIAGGAGLVTFHPTDDGTGSGNALYSEIEVDSINAYIFDNAALYAIGSPTVSGDKKTITMTVNKLGASSANALLNLLGGVVSVLNGLTLTAAPNGVTVKCAVTGIK